MFPAIPEKVAVPETPTTILPTLVIAVPPLRVSVPETPMLVPELPLPCEVAEDKTPVTPPPDEEAPVTESEVTAVDVMVPVPVTVRAPVTAVVPPFETEKYEPSLTLAFKIAALFGKAIEEIFEPAAANGAANA